MKIQIPHIAYTLHVINRKEAKGEAKEYLKNMVACHEKIDSNSSCIFIKLPIKPKEVPTLCHELIHVLQHIAIERDIDFKKEEEHFAYIFHYLMNKILKYEYL